jgi:RNA polymerase sigma-70 factor, ECF subfamily
MPDSSVVSCALPSKDYEWAAQEMQDLVARRLSSLHRSAYRLLGSTADAEDAVQDALLSAWKHLHQFRGESQMSTWLTSIVCNCARMQLRRRPRCLQPSLDETLGLEHEYSSSDRLSDPGPNPEEQYRKRELAVHWINGINQLPSVLRKTYQLREIDGLSIREIARKLELPSGTVKARLSRARAKLKKPIRKLLKVRL